MPRILLTYGLCLPLAIFLGYMLASPSDFNTFAIVGLTFFALLIPLLLKWHELLLIVAWNAAVIVFFLPGQPAIGSVLAFLSLGIAFLERTMNKRKE